MNMVFFKISFDKELSKSLDGNVVLFSYLGHNSPLLPLLCWYL
jgi:hypothetical protein